MIMHIRPELVTGEPVDLVFLNAVKDHLIAKRNAVGGAGVGAFAADLAEVFYVDINGLVRHQWQVGQNGIRHMDAGAIILVDDEPVSAQLADVSGYSSGLRGYHSAQGGIAQLLDVAL